MDNNRQHSGIPSGFQYAKRNNPRQINTGTRQNINNTRDNDDDLIIEENTVYEIDRECYERMKKQKSREK